MDTRHPRFARPRRWLARACARLCPFRHPSPCPQYPPPTPKSDCHIRHPPTADRLPHPASATDATHPRPDVSVPLSLLSRIRSRRRPRNGSPPSPTHLPPVAHRAPAPAADCLSQSESAQSLLECQRDISNNNFPNLTCQNSPELHIISFLENMTLTASEPSQQTSSPTTIEVTRPTCPAQSALVHSPCRRTDSCTNLDARTIAQSTAELHALPLPEGDHCLTNVLPPRSSCHSGLLLDPHPLPPSQPSSLASASAASSVPKSPSHPDRPPSPTCYHHSSSSLPSPITCTRTAASTPLSRTRSNPDMRRHISGAQVAPAGFRLRDDGWMSHRGSLADATSYDDPWPTLVPYRVLTDWFEPDLTDADLPLCVRPTDRDVIVLRKIRSVRWSDHTLHVFRLASCAPAAPPRGIPMLQSSALAPATGDVAHHTSVPCPCSSATYASPLHSHSRCSTCKSQTAFCAQSCSPRATGATPIPPSSPLSPLAHLQSPSKCSDATDSSACCRQRFSDLDRRIVKLEMIQQELCRKVLPTDSTDSSITRTSLAEGYSSRRYDDFHLQRRKRSEMCRNLSSVSDKSDWGYGFHGT